MGKPPKILICNDSVMVRVKAKRDRFGNWIISTRNNKSLQWTLNSQP